MTVDLNELEPFGRDVGFGYLDGTVRSPRKYHPRLVLNDDATGSMLRALRDELRRSSAFTFSVAFVSPRAIALLKQELIDFVGDGRIITSDYLGFNSPTAFAELLNLKTLGIDVRLYRESAFHPKGYVFRHPDGVTAILGSSNLTENALVKNHEWNIQVSAAFSSDLGSQFANLLDEQVADSAPLTPEWVDDYARGYQAPGRRVAERPDLPAPEESAEIGSSGGIVPNLMQEEALAAIARVRDAGNDKAVVISATGTGKTILSALDVRQFDPERMLFVAHREQILDRAMLEFARVLDVPASELGKVAGSHREMDRRFVFATVQTLSRDEYLQSIDPRAFDYILIDEVHRAGSTSYERLIAHFEPKFLLGMTATPERTDGVNVFEIFDYNVPYEIRLNSALELDMLAPFHYYGVADITFADGVTTDDATPLTRLVAPERVDHIVSAISKYGQAGIQPRGLIFCSRNEEARALATELNGREVRGRRLRVQALSGADSIEQREAAVARLESGDLDYLLTVDIFNEGVDIPSVNQVIMLRQTQSGIVFVQQLGRGLRKAPGKDYLVVIDFIGNYTNNYLIPIALFGDDSLSRESLRKNLISAEEIGVISGLSSVRFDRIAQERVLRSLASAKLDSLPNLKAAIETVRNRVGRVPLLSDFLKFESADPVVLANRLGTYPNLLAKVASYDHGLSEADLNLLKAMSRELLTAKRPHELLVLRLLLGADTVAIDDVVEVLAGAGLAAGESVAKAVVRSLTLDFNTQPEVDSLSGAALAVVAHDGSVSVSDELRYSYDSSPALRAQVDDLVETGIAIAQGRYAADEPFTPSRQYSRKDACRLLNWPGNFGSTIYGYKVDRATRSCPVFVTYHKANDVAASTAYEDELLDPTTMLWYTRSRRTLQSDEVRAIVDNEVDIHVFAKKDDADGGDFFYLGRARAENAEQTTMPDGAGKDLSVVRMHLRFERPIEAGLFDYFEPRVT